MMKKETKFTGLKKGSQDIRYVRYWEPYYEVQKYLESFIKPGDKVLEIGPGENSFPKATCYIGSAEEERKLYDNFTLCDVAQDRIPFPDKHFDFVYSRHVLEDTLNPMHAVREITRTCKKGYLEMPSTIAECWEFAESHFGDYKGFLHHRYFCWNDGQLNFMAKFPYIEKISFNKIKIAEMLKDPFNWITPFMFEDTIKYKHHEHGWNKEFMLNNANSYVKIINRAITVSYMQGGHFKKIIQDFTEGKETRTRHAQVE